MRDLCYCFLLLASACIVQIVQGTVAPTNTPTITPPTASPTLYPTQILQTRFNVYVNVRTEPQFSAESFKSNYRVSVEEAVASILKLPHQEVTLGQVLVTDVVLIDDGESLAAQTQDPYYTVNGEKCSLVGVSQNEVTLKISTIIENTGYANKTFAFWDISRQIASATDSGRLQNLTNTNIPRRNPGSSLRLLNVSCFHSTAQDITEFILRSPVPSAMPTYHPDSDGPKKYAVAICMSILLFVGMFVMAAGSVVDNRDRSYYEMERDQQEQEDLNNQPMHFSDTFSGKNISDMQPIDYALHKDSRKMVQEAVCIVKSAVPYLEYIQRLDILRAYVSTENRMRTAEAAAGSDDLSGLLVEEETELPWLYYLSYLFGAHDTRYAVNMWLQHRWLSCLFFAPTKARALRCFCVFYLAVTMLCFDCLLIVHTDRVKPAREVHTLFVREVLILCCITALTSASIYGVIETVIHYSFDEVRPHIKSVAVDLSKPKNPNRGVLSRAANWQSVSVELDQNYDAAASIGDDATSLGGSPSNVSRRNRSGAGGSADKGSRSRSLNTRLHTGTRQLVSASNAEQLRSPSPLRSPRTSPRKQSAGQNRRVAPHQTGTTQNHSPEFLELLQNALEGEEYLSSESLIDELLRIQEDILICREAIHTSCNRNRIQSSGPKDMQSDSNDEGMDEFEIAVEDALLAVQFDAMWGLDSEGQVRIEGKGISHWRDVANSADSNLIVCCWKFCISRLFTAYKGDIQRPKEGRGLNNALINLTSDIVRIRRQVMKEQLKLYSDILAVEPIAPNDQSLLHPNDSPSGTRDSGVGGGASVEFGLMTSDLSQLTTLNRIKYLTRGDELKTYRKRLVQLFQDDTLPPMSAAIVRNQIHRSRWVTERLFADRTLKFIGASVVLLSLLTMMGWIYYYSIHILNKRQTSILIVYLLWLALDIFVIETLSLFCRHVVIPSFAHRDVSDVISWLVYNVVSKDKARRKQQATAEGSLDEDGLPFERAESDGSLRVRPVLHGEVIPDSASGILENDCATAMRTFNAAKHLFVSVRLAQMTAIKRPFLEAVSISEFHTLWPKKSYMTEFGARNMFGYFTEKGACLFSEKAEGGTEMNNGGNSIDDGNASQFGRQSSRSGRPSAIVPTSQSVPTPSIAVCAPSVAQWVPQSATGDSLRAHTVYDTYFSYAAISSNVKLLATMSFYYYIEVLPILLQNVVIEYILWAMVLWLLYLSIYIVNTTTALLVLPVMAVLVIIRILLAMLSNKNRMGLAEDEFELEPEMGEGRELDDGDEGFYNDEEEEEEEIIDGEQDDIHREGDNNSEQNYDDTQYMGNKRARSQQSQYEGEEEYVSTRRAFHDRDQDEASSYRPDTGGDSRGMTEMDDGESEFGIEYSLDEYNEMYRIQPDRAELPPKQHNRPAPLPPSGARGVRSSGVVFSEHEETYSRSAGDPVMQPQDLHSDTQSAVRSNRPHAKSYDHQPRPSPQNQKRNANSAEVLRRERTEAVAVAGGESHNVLRSRTAHGAYHDRLEDDIDEGRAKGKSAPEVYGYMENDTPFTEVPAYGDSSAYKGGGAVTPAMGMVGRGGVGYQDDSKYNSIISPPNATPQLPRRYIAAAAAPAPGLTSSAVKKAEADMKQWAQYEIENDEPDGKHMYDDDIGSDVGDEDDEEEEEEEEDKKLEQNRKSPSANQSNRNLPPVSRTPPVDDKIVFTMSRFGKSN